MARFSLVKMLLVSLLLSPFMITGCTREKPETKLKFKVPRLKNMELQAAGKIGSQSVSGVLVHMVLNLSGPGISGVKNLAGENLLDSVVGGSGSTITIEVPEPPVGKDRLIQYMGVYQDQVNGGLVFTYGDTKIEVEEGVENSATINASPVASAAQLGWIGGRFYGPSMTNGPTGRTITEIEPLGKPRITIDEGTIYQGWFTKFLALDINPSLPIKIIHRLDSGQVIKTFDVANGLTQLRSAPGIDRLVVSVPMYKSYDGDIEGNELRIFGHFNMDGAANTLTSRAVCYTEIDTPVKYSYKLTGLNVPVDWNHDGSASTEFVRIEGGQEVSGGNCTPALHTSGAAFSINERDLAQSGLYYLGPFKLLDKESHSNAFVRASIEDVADYWTLNLAWSLNPAAAGNVDGFTVYYKEYDSYYGSDELFEPIQNHDESIRCDEVAGLGFSEYHLNTLVEYGSIPTGLDSTDVMARSVVGILCPFKNVSGVKTYGSSGVPIHCFANCTHDRIYSFGTRASSTPVATLTSPTHNISWATGWDYAKARITSKNAPDLTSGTVSFGVPGGMGASYLVGRDVLIHVSAMNPTDCGYHLGSPIENGAYTVLPILNRTGDTITVPMGSFLDSLDASDFIYPYGNADFCYVQAVQISEVYDANLSNYDLEVLPFDPNTDNGGGILALRVNGTLTLTADNGIKADGAGFITDPAANEYIKTPFGETFGTQGSGVIGAGGGPSHFAAGGKGSGWVSPVGVMADGGVAYGYSGDMTSNLYFGGSGGTGGVYVSTTLGNGGGIVFLSARRVVTAATGENFISANGITPTGTNPQGNGGGGGGSVFTNLGIVEGVAPLIFKANGGDGGTNGVFRGGGGGAGEIFATTCNYSAVPLIGEVLGGSGDLAEDGEDGYDFIFEGYDYCY